MEKNLINLIEEFQKGDTVQFLLITEKFSPVIFKYARLLYKDEMEDMISELKLSLLEAIYKLKYYSNEGQCINFFNTALKNKFLELYRKSKKKFDHEQQLEHDYDDFTACYEYADAELIEDMKQYLSSYPPLQREILLSLFCEGKSNAEAASQHNVSRQYTNRLKNKLCHEIKQEFIA